MSVFKKIVIFNNFDFFLLWIGQCLSQAGTRMYQIAIVWWILSIVPGNGGKALGIFLVAGALPSILLVKMIGAVVDRHKSKSILVICDIVAFIVVGAVGWAIEKNVMTLIIVYVAGLLVALEDAFYNPTLNKAVPEIVKEDDIESAVAFQSSTQYMASFGGAVAGALLIGKLGISMVVYINALSYLISAVINYIIKFRYIKQCEQALQDGIVGSEKGIQKNVIPGEESGKEKAHGMDVFEHEKQVSGWAIFKDMPVLKKVLIGFGCINFFTVPILVILPVYTKETLHSNASVLGYLEASLWIGLLIGTFSSKILSFIKSIIKLGSLCLFVLGFCLFLPGLLVNKIFYITMLFIGGFALGINNVKFVSMFQAVVDPEIKGRFFAVMNALISFTFPVSYLLFGILADVLSPPLVCVIQGFGVMAIAIFFGRLSSQEYQLYKKSNDGKEEI